MSNRFREGDYYLLDAYTGFKIRRSEAVRDPDGLWVHKDHVDEPHAPMPRPRPKRPPRIVHPEPADTFLAVGDVTSDDL